MRLYKQVVIATLVFCLGLLAVRVTDGFVGPALFILGCILAILKRPGLAVSCLLFFPFAVCVNPYIVTPSDVFILVARIGGVVLGLMIGWFSRRCPINMKVPISFLGLYLGVELISSSMGYSPTVSYLKLVFFSLYILSLWMVTRTISGDLEALHQVRVFLLGISCFIIVGTALTLPFPAVAYPLNSRWLLKDGVDVATASEILRTQYSGMRLLAGVTMHSQTLAPLLAITIGYLLLDMLLLERRLRALHMGLIMVGCVFAYMTRSRTALFALVVAMSFVMFVVLRNAKMPLRTRTRVRYVGVGLVALACLAGVVVEVQNHTISKWLFKGMDADVSVYEAVTSSRMGAVDELMCDFKKSPLIGCGFQVNEESARFRGKMVFSAPVEKGLLPLVVLGEGGVIGSIAFLIFLWMFYIICWRRRMLATMSGFTTMLATNIGEATFFSPGAGGGMLWSFAIVGGMTIDSITKILNGRIDMVPRYSVEDEMVRYA